MKKLILTLLAISQTATASINWIATNSTLPTTGQEVIILYANTELAPHGQFKQDDRELKISKGVFHPAVGWFVQGSQNQGIYYHNAVMFWHEYAEPDYTSIADE